ncbi:MAG: hypothetical protein K6T29_10010 [Peptococcaceae bacterium]|nr:hypothetical protein [Peptococcaceae bacterium]
MEFNATLLAQVIDFLILLGFLYAIYAVGRYFRDLKERMKRVEQKIDELNKREKSNNQGG